MEDHGVKICTGTACYVLGGAELLNLESKLPPELKSRVKVEGAVCLGLCQDPANGRAPFALVDGRPVSQASVDKILRILSGGV